MILSKRSNGNYYVIYTQSNGKRTRISTKSKTKVEAIRFLSNFEKELEKRKSQKLPSVTVSEYAKSFLSYSEMVHTPKTNQAYRSSLNAIEKHLGTLSLREITYSRMNNYFEQRLRTSSIYQARKDFITINSLFNKAIAEGYILQNPCKNVKRFRIPQKQPLFFSQMEYDLLLHQVVENDLKDLIMFAVQTGLRQMELITLDWNQVDFKEKFLILDNRGHLTKSKKVRSIPLTNKALQILTERELHKKSQLVFTLRHRPITQSNLTHKFKKCVVNANINPRLTFHSLRHTFASWLVQKGVPIYSVSKLLGHSSVNVTQIYSHLNTESLRNAIDMLNN